MKINAIIFGTTGMVGEGVLHIALNNPYVESVLVIGRRSSGVHHPKLKELVHSNLFDFSSLENQLKGYNACYFCLGTTSIGKSEEEYTRTTYGLTMSISKVLSTLNPDMTFCYVSGEGTDSTEQGRSMWARVKGKTENDLAKLPFKAVYNFRPGFIKPIKGMKNTLSFAKPLLVLYPFFKKLLPNHGCTLEELGTSMISVTRNRYSQQILNNSDITKLGKTKS